MTVYIAEKPDIATAMAAYLWVIIARTSTNTVTRRVRSL